MPILNLVNVYNYIIVLIGICFSFYITIILPGVKSRLFEMIEFTQTEIKILY